MIPCSAVTGTGLDPLREAILASARGVAREEEPDRPFRLAVDRVFTLPGAGTVVTGTAHWGRVREGDELVALPGDLRVRVRGVQVHGESRPEAAAGERVALRLAGASVQELPRGEQLLSSGAWRPAQRLALDIRLLGDATLREGDHVWLHLLAARVPARVERLHPAELSAQASGRAIVHLARPIFAVPGDRVVLRRVSPTSTLGGGEVLDVQPPRLRRREAAALAQLPRPWLDLPAAVVGWVTQAGPKGVAATTLAARLGVREAGVEALLGRLVDGGQLVVVPGPSTAAGGARGGGGGRGEIARGAVRPRGASGSRWRSCWRVWCRRTPGAFGTSTWTSCAGAGCCARWPGARWRAMRHPWRTPSRHELRSSTGRPGSRRPRRRRRRPRWARTPGWCRAWCVFSSTRNGSHVSAASGCMHRELLDEVAASVQAWGVENFEVGAFKDRFGLTRKLAIPVLEWLDSQRVTRREGDRRRILRRRPGTTPLA